MLAKRCFDLFFSLPGLLLLLPLFGAVAVWIKLDSPGPVFFRQRRVGLAGKEFFIFKFRTMAVDAERRGRQITVGADARITASGHFLRRYKIDELPQLLNVLRGEMSLVGPRPEVPCYVAQYAASDRRIVLSVPPGITDNASIAYRRESEILAQAADPEAAYIHDVLPVKLRYYREYVAGRSLRLDLIIIMRTLRAILRG